MFTSIILDVANWGDGGTFFLDVLGGGSGLSVRSLNCFQHMTEASVSPTFTVQPLCIPPAWLLTQQLRNDWNVFVSILPLTQPHCDIFHAATLMITESRGIMISDGPVVASVISQKQRGEMLHVHLFSEMK